MSKVTFGPFQRRWVCCECKEPYWKKGKLYCNVDTESEGPPLTHVCTACGSQKGFTSEIGCYEITEHFWSNPERRWILRME